MRTVNRNLHHKVYFHSLGDTPYVHSIAPGWSALPLERITWNTDVTPRIRDEATQATLLVPKRRRSQPLEVFYLNDTQ